MSSDPPIPSSEQWWFRRPHQWGLVELIIDEQSLNVGRFAVTAAKGFLIDGTPFDIPGRQQVPPALHIPEGTRDQKVYLAPAAMPPGTLAQDETGIAVDSASKPTEFRLSLESSDLRHSYGLALVHVAEQRAGRILLDESYVPPCLDCRASAKLLSDVDQIAGLLSAKSEALSHRLTQPGRGVADLNDYLLLQAVNSYLPLFRYLRSAQGLHPETLYRTLLELAGALETFLHTGKPPPAFPGYCHDALQQTLRAVIAHIVCLLTETMAPRDSSPVPIELQDRKYGIRVAVIPDRDLLRSSNLVLLARANIAPDVLRTRFPAQVKVGPVERIRDLVNLQQPGIGLFPLAIAPRQLPYRAGSIYFELDTGSELWKQLETSGALAMHVAGDFPDLQLELWAIRA